MKASTFIQKLRIEDIINDRRGTFCYEEIKLPKTLDEVNETYTALMKKVNTYIPANMTQRALEVHDWIMKVKDAYSIARTDERKIHLANDLFRVGLDYFCGKILKKEYENVVDYVIKSLFE